MIKIFLYVGFIFFPFITLAYNDMLGIIYSVPDILNGVVFLIVGLAVLAFLWGIVKYLMSGGDEKQLEESKKFMLWGIVGITIMVSVWGIISILGNMFGIHISGTPTLPRRE
jgi:hypothetical protein